MINRLEKQFDRSVLDDLPVTLDVMDLGEGLKLTSSTPKEFTHELAEWVLTLNEFAPDRPLDNTHVARLKIAMERGTFHPELCTIITCVFGGKEYRMNGQHTAWARLEMPPSYHCQIRCNKYTAKTDADMRALYASIDRGKARTKGNVINSYLYATDEWSGFKKKEIRLLAEGMGYWLWPSSHQRTMRDGDDRAYLLMTDHKTLAHKVGEFLVESRRTGAHVLRAPVVGAMFASFDKASAQAVEFWAAVRDGIGFQTKDDSRLKLRNALTESSIAIGKGAMEARKSVSAEEMYRWCIRCWNCFRNGQPMKQLKADMHLDRPKVA